MVVPHFASRLGTSGWRRSLQWYCSTRISASGRCTWCSEGWTGLLLKELPDSHQRRNSWETHWTLDLWVEYRFVLQSIDLMSSKIHICLCNADNDYIDTFLLTYRTFISPSELLKKLFERYETGASEISNEGLSEFELENTEKKQKIIRLRVGNVLKRWLTDHFHDFSADPSLVQALYAGLDNMQERNLAESLRKLAHDQLAVRLCTVPFSSSLIANWL